MKSLIIASVLFSSSAIAYDFKGSWDCFDPNDGGIGFARIAKVDGDIIKEGADSWHGPCGYGWPAVTYTGPLTYVNGRLEGTWYLDCQAEPTNEDGDREFQVEYKINRSGELVESLFNDQGELIRDPIVCTRK